MTTTVFAVPLRVRLTDGDAGGGLRLEEALIRDVEMTKVGKGFLGRKLL